MRLRLSLHLLGGAMALGVASWLGCSSSSSSGQNPASPLTTGDAGADAADNDGDTDATDDSPPAPQCTDYCTAVMANCTGTLGAPASQAAYASMDGCLNQCQQINAGAIGDPDQNDTLGCRLVHATAAKSNAAANCVAAGASGGGVCDDTSTDAGAQSRCAAFCGQVLALCTVDNGVQPLPYADVDSCMKACGTSFKFDTTQPELTAQGNTLNCRQYHLILAYDAADGGTAGYECQHLGYPATAFCR